MRSRVEPFEGRLLGGECIGERRAERRRLPFERTEAVDVVRIERRDLARVLSVVAPEQERTPVEKRRERCGLLAIGRIAVARELKVGDDARIEQAADVCARRDGVSRPRGLADCRAADAIVALEDDDRESGTGKIRGGDEAVVAGADDRDVVQRRRFLLRRGPGTNGGPGANFRSWRRLLSTSSHPIGVNARQSCGRAS